MSDEVEARKLYSIADAARLIGVSAMTLRRWDSKGLIPVARLPSGYRRFSQEQIDQIQHEMTRKKA